MSIAAINAVSASSITPSGRKYVALALANYADEQWSCFPSVAQISKWTALGKSAVRGHLDALEADGIITRKRHRREDGTLGRYRFFIQRQKLALDTQPVPESDQCQISPPGEKQRSPVPESGAHNHQLKPSSKREEGKRPVVSWDEVSTLDPVLQRPDDVYAEYGEEEIGVLIIEFPLLDVHSELETLWNWAWSKGIVKDNERKDAIYGALKKKHDKLEVGRELLEGKSAPLAQPSASLLQSKKVRARA